MKILIIFNARKLIAGFSAGMIRCRNHKRFLGVIAVFWKASQRRHKSQCILFCAFYGTWQPYFVIKLMPERFLIIVSYITNYRKNTYRFLLWLVIEHNIRSENLLSYLSLCPHKCVLRLLGLCCNYILTADPSSGNFTDRGMHVDLKVSVH